MTINSHPLVGAMRSSLKKVRRQLKAITKHARVTKRFARNLAEKAYMRGYYEALALYEKFEKGELNGEELTAKNVQIGHSEEE